MAASITEKALTAELDLHRAQMASQIAVLRQKLDVPRQVKGSLAKHPAVWFAGAAIAGFVISQIPRRKKALPEPVNYRYVRERGSEQKKESKPLMHALMLMALKSAADAAKPMALNWMKQYLTAYANATSGQTAQHDPTRYNEPVSAAHEREPATAGV